MNRRQFLGKAAAGAATVIGAGALGYEVGKTPEYQSLLESLQGSIVAKSNQVGDTINRFCHVEGSTYINSLLGKFGVSRSELVGIALKHANSRVHAFSEMVTLLTNKNTTVPTDFADTLLPSDRHLLIAAVFSAGCMPSITNEIDSQTGMPLQMRDTTLGAFYSAVDSITNNMYLYGTTLDGNLIYQEQQLQFAKDALHGAYPQGLQGYDGVSENPQMLLRQMAGVLGATY